MGTTEGATTAQRTRIAVSSRYEGISVEAYGGASGRCIVAPADEIVVLAPLDGYGNAVIVREFVLA